ncbi:hypothetical protein UB46_41580 [Burkholderiaceae bacterium 16]|nr:hypothetical protein UB46_41580 [Burkholderiaceae bacterium 16]
MSWRTAQGLVGEADLPGDTGDQRQTKRAAGQVLLRYGDACRRIAAREDLRAQAAHDDVDTLAANALICVLVQVLLGEAECVQRERAGAMPANPFRQFPRDLQQDPAGGEARCLHRQRGGQRLPGRLPAVQEGAGRLHLPGALVGLLDIALTLQLLILFLPRAA